MHDKDVGPQPKPEDLVIIIESLSNHLLNRCRQLDEALGWKAEQERESYAYDRLRHSGSLTMGVRKLRERVARETLVKEAMAKLSDVDQQVLGLGPGRVEQLCDEAPVKIKVNALTVPQPTPAFAQSDLPESFFGKVWGNICVAARNLVK